VTRHDLRFAVVGAGMAGILTAIKLREAGFENFTVYEKADRVGGTWRENRYPGLSCDVPSHLYSYSFALNPEWSHAYSPGPEIQSYFEEVAERYGVMESIRFGDEVTRCEYVEGRWQLTTAAGRHDRVDVVIAATGVLHHPRYPDLRGLDEFEGAKFHSARWDADAVIDGARVGIVGTGSTAVQIVCAIVERTAKLCLFQRTAQWVMPIPNPEYSAAERDAFRSDPGSLQALHDSLSDLFDMFSGAVVDADSPGMAMIEEACRSNLESNVSDPVLRERLRPDYRAACKRLIVAPAFYEAISHPHAELVTDPIEAVERAGVRTVDGRLHELDVLVLATGFQADAFVRPMEVIGRGGRSLDEAWEKRPVAYLSISVPEFPNFFMLNGPNGPVGNFSLIEVAELQLGYVLQLVERLRSGDCRQISPTVEALAEFEELRLAASAKTVWATGCRSWYLDDRGVPSVWPWPFPAFRAAMVEPEWSAYELRA
jgi:cation diffusion facilitator CzcD-associated flavoprotein CzcO